MAGYGNVLKCVDGVDQAVGLDTSDNTHGTDMLGEPKVRRYILKQISRMLGSLTPPAYSSTLMHQDFILRDRQWWKIIYIIAYSLDQSTYDILYLTLFQTRERSCESSYSVGMRAVIPSEAAVAVTQYMCLGMTFVKRRCRDSNLEGWIFLHIALSHRYDFDMSFLLPLICL